MIEDRSLNRVPLILGYHSVTIRPQTLLGVSVEQFSWQMNWLYSHGFKGITLSDLLSGQTGEKFCIVTFDDGYADNLVYAAGILAHYSWPAVVFVITDYIDARRPFPWYSGISNSRETDLPLTWNQVRSLQEKGWEIGAHTCTHPILTRIPSEAAYSEIVGSKERLEATLGRRVASFCYPASQVNATLVNLVRQAGFRAAVKSGSRVTRGGFLELPRVAIYGDDSRLSFRLKIFLRGLVYRNPKFGILLKFAKKKVHSGK